MRAEGNRGAGGAGQRVEQRRGLLSERPPDGGPSRSHRGRAKRTPALLTSRRWTGPARATQVRATTGIAAPVMPLASSVEKNTTSAAISAAGAQRVRSDLGV